jgi:integrase
LGHHRLDQLKGVHISALYAVMGQLGGEMVVEDRHPTLLRLFEARSSNRAQRLSPATIQRVHAALRSALNLAVKKRRMKANPALFVELEPARRPRAVVWTPDRVAHWEATGEFPPVAVWTPEQVGAFPDHSVEDRLYALFHLIAYRGLRRGEAIGLPWLEADLPGRRLRIMQQVVQIGWDVEIGRPKTDGGERHVTLDGRTAVALERWSQLQAAERDACGSGWRRTGLVFTDACGDALHPDSSQRRCSD